MQAAKAAARERYTAVAELLKAEAGVTRHYTFDKLGGLAWTGQHRILAPEGVTRRQLYVLAHECGHIMLHSSPLTRTKPGHVQEHEAETYAHRAFQRHGIEVPEKSALLARAYVGQWILKDHAAGLPICEQALLFASGRRSPHDPLPSVDGQPPRDFSKSLERFIAKGTRAADEQERTQQQARSAVLQHVRADATSLTKDETALLDKLMKAAHALDRKHIAGAYAIVAIVMEQTEQNRLSGQSALPALARGLDGLQRLRTGHRQMRRASLRAVFSDRTWGLALAAAVLAAASFLVAWDGSAIFYYAGGFCAAVAIAALIHLAVKVFTR